MSKQVDYKKLPYFETKVVKVKKRGRTKHKYFTTQKIDGELYGFYYNKEYKMDVKIEKIKKRHPKGNWVNGENLDEIEFPVPCSYKNGGTKFYGEMNSSFRIGHGQEYILSYVGEQGCTSIVEQNKSLKNLIEAHDIHILKGKIIIFEESEEE